MQGAPDLIRTTPEQTQKTIKIWTDALVAKMESEIIESALRMPNYQPIGCNIPMAWYRLGESMAKPKFNEMVEALAADRKNQPIKEIEKCAAAQEAFEQGMKAGINNRIKKTLTELLLND